MYIKIHVTTGAKRETIRKKSSDTYEVWVCEQPKNNQANKRITDVLKSFFEASRVRLVSGHRSHSKIFDIK